MSLVVDASVFVASVRVTEEKHSSSRQFLSRLVVSHQHVSAPSLVIPECACAVGRLTGKPAQADRTKDLLRNFRWLRFEPISIELAESAADLGGRCRLRGSDAYYVALCARHDATLITWDQEMPDRGAAVVKAMTPEAWLQQQEQAEDV
jgi:predicted nucleic acid-binding protein